MIDHREDFINLLRKQNTEEQYPTSPPMTPSCPINLWKFARCLKLEALTEEGYDPTDEEHVWPALELAWQEYCRREREGDDS